MFRRFRSLWKLAAVLLFALLVRVAFAWVYIHSHPARALSTIPFLFEPGNIAYSIANGNGFASPFHVETGPTAWMTPVYPYILAAIFKVFGLYTFQAYVAAAALNIAFSVLTCVPVFFTGRFVGGERAGVIAAVLWAVFPAAIVLPYESLWDGSMAALLATSILWATLCVAGSARIRDWCGYGLLWGFALMTTAALVSLLPFLLGWAGYRPRAKPLYAAAIILLCCAPWTVRNYRVFHALVPLRSVGGLALWLGNTPEHHHPISNQAEREKYVAMGEIAYMREKQREGIDFLLAHPGEELRGSMDRFVEIWTGAGSFSGSKGARFYWVVGFNLIAAVGTVIGLIRLWRRNGFVFAFLVYPLIFPAIYYFALAPPRYRHPMDPVLLLLTAVAIWPYDIRETIKS